MKDHTTAVNNLFAGQLTEWDLARNNYNLLDNVRTRKIKYPGFEIIIQFNPGRITSSAAKVDTRSIEARPCFLCEKNRPPQQRGIQLDGYVILINPFPIFRRHLTIVCDQHTDQRIESNFPSMLELAESLPEYIIFYNGPQCGASAPDHLHFQAGNKGFLPIENDISNNRLVKQVSSRMSARVSVWKDYGRGVITVQGNRSEELVEFFARYYGRFAITQPDRPEPMLNILASFNNGVWTVHIIPRKLHRPSCYFAEGEARILLSPASVDMGGVLITPREEDFNKLTMSDINRIFTEVCLGEEDITSLIADII